MTDKLTDELVEVIQFTMDKHLIAEDTFILGEEKFISALIQALNLPEIIEVLREYAGKPEGQRARDMLKKLGVR